LARTPARARVYIRLCVYSLCVYIAPDCVKCCAVDPLVLDFHVETPANHSDLGDSGGIDPTSEDPLRVSPFRFPVFAALTIIDICT